MHGEQTVIYHGLKEIARVMNRSMTTIKLTEDELKNHLDRYSREPFKKLLLSALANQPDPGIIKVFAISLRTGLRSI